MSHLEFWLTPRFGIFYRQKETSCKFWYPDAVDDSRVEKYESQVAEGLFSVFSSKQRPTTYQNTLKQKKLILSELK